MWGLGWDVLGWKGIRPGGHPAEHRLISHAVFSPKLNVVAPASTPTAVLAGRRCPAGTRVSCVSAADLGRWWHRQRTQVQLSYLLASPVLYICGLGQGCMAEPKKWPLAMSSGSQATLPS